MNEIDLIKLQHFFEVDVRIKKEIYNMMPPTNNDFLDKRSLCKYTDDFDDSLDYIFTELKCISLDIFGKNSEAFQKIKQMEAQTKKNFYKCGLDINKLRYFYKVFISNMAPSFVDEVKDSCVGYYVFRYFPINKANSVNEILHLFHSYILNNERILQSIPKIAEKQNQDRYPIALRGVSCEHSTQLFDQFPIDLMLAWTDIVCLNNKKILMMIRDRGHALTIEITINDNTARIEYFVPKICNVDMVNALPGINRVNDNSVGATGVFETDIANMPQILFKFISKVPTDLDMVFENKTR